MSLHLPFNFQAQYDPSNQPQHSQSKKCYYDDSTTNYNQKSVYHIILINTVALLGRASGVGEIVAVGTLEVAGCCEGLADEDDVTMTTDDDGTVTTDDDVTLTVDGSISVTTDDKN